MTQAKNALQEDENIIRIGFSPMTPAQLLMELWSKVQTLHPDIKFQIVSFENTPENAREIPGNLGKDIAVVGGIFDETMLKLRRCAGLELVRGPFHCAVSIHHLLAANPDHMASNAAVDFTISDEDMELLKHMEHIADYSDFNIFPVFSGKPLA